MRPKSKGSKRKMADVDMLYPDPQAYKRAKKSKPVDDSKHASQSPPAKPIRDRSQDVIPSSQTEKNWAEKKVKIITPSQDPVKRSRDRLKLKKNKIFR